MLEQHVADLRVCTFFRTVEKNVGSGGEERKGISILAALVQKWSKNHTLDSKLQRCKVKAHYDLLCQMKRGSCSEVISSYIIMLKNRQCYKLF